MHLPVSDESMYKTLFGDSLYSLRSKFIDTMVVQQTSYGGMDIRYWREVNADTKKVLFIFAFQS